MRKYSALLAFVILAACNDTDTKGHDPSLDVKPTPVISFKVVSIYNHDTSAYTQGLEFYKGKLYEGTGDFKNSSLRITDYKTGRVEAKYMMGTDSIFGEGITILKDKLYQLTWESHIVYVYDPKNITKPVKTLKWPYEGWGMTNNGTDLIISDGSANLYFVNPDDLRVKTTMSVNDNGGPVPYLNELEYIDGFIYANVFGKDYILKIDPSSGRVIAQMVFGNLIQQIAPGYVPKPGDEVLNGIAYDSTSKKILVTGKRWPKMIEIKLN
jgi:glutaminyl-peptide cyclotransferase